MRLLDEEIDELARLEREATPGPWLTDPVEDYDDSIHEVYGPSYTVHGRRSATVISQCAPPKDAALIAAARNALSRLIAEVRERRAAAGLP